MIVTNSAAIPLKGLSRSATSMIARERPIRLMVIGSPNKNGNIEKFVEELGIGGLVTFTGRISGEEFVRQYVKASVAVVPSVYEGFGLPAGEAMACGVPVVSTTGGALPEVVGNAGILVPPARRPCTPGPSVPVRRPRKKSVIMRKFPEIMNAPESTE